MNDKIEFDFKWTKLPENNVDDSQFTPLERIYDKVNFVYINNQKVIIDKILEKTILVDKKMNEKEWNEYLNITLNYFQIDNRDNIVVYCHPEIKTNIFKDENTGEIIAYEECIKMRYGIVSKVNKIKILN